MKKIVCHRILMLVSTIILASPAMSQELALNTQSEKKTFFASEAKDPSGEIYSIDRVDKKVLRSFQRSFGEKPDAVWYKTAEGFVARFKSQKKATNVYISANGVIDYRIDYYFEDALPKNIRHVVRSNFYDYVITHVSEVQKNDFVCYLVKIEDKATVKTVKIIDEEFSVVEDLVKR